MYKQNMSIVKCTLYEKMSCSFGRGKTYGVSNGGTSHAPSCKDFFNSSDKSPFKSSRKIKLNFFLVSLSQTAPIDQMQEKKNMPAKKTMSNKIL